MSTTEAPDLHTEPLSEPEDDGQSEPREFEEKTDDEIREEARGGEEDTRLAKALELNARVMKARGEYEAAKETASSRKKAWEASAEELSDYLASLVEELPLFDKKPEPLAHVHTRDCYDDPGPGNGSPQLVCNNGEPATIDEPAPGWQEVTLASIHGFPAGARKALEEHAGVFTVGGLAEFSKTKRLTDLPGVGPAACEKIENAMSDFWARRCEAIGSIGEP